MGVDTKHPEYVDLAPDWETIKDANAGQKAVKEKGFQYLPPTAGMVLDGCLEGKEPGKSNYEAYKMRAVFPDFTNGAIETLVGILDAKPPEIKLPAGMEYLRARATFSGETLISALRRIHSMQLETGRVGILGDMPAGVLDPESAKPYIALYDGTSVINWDVGTTTDTVPDTLNLVVLDESGFERTDQFDWKEVKQYRVLMVVGGTYKVGVFNEAGGLTFVQDQMITPMYRGTPLTRIPFQFINTRDNLPSPDRPPLLPLAEICMTIYRGEADYRQNLYMQGQETLVVIGALGTGNLDSGTDGDVLRTGAGARIDINLGGDAKYIGVSADGLSAQRDALNDDKDLAAVRSGQLLAPGKLSMESGEALKTRVAAQTATLTSIARCSCEGLERLLKDIAEWMGENPEEVAIKPNLDFTNIAIQGQDLVQLVTAKNLGFPLAYKTIHGIAYERGLTKNSFEDELEELKKDPPELIKRAAEMSGSLEGNNPTSSAGGPKKSTQGRKAQTSRPKE